MKKHQERGRRIELIEQKDMRKPIGVLVERFTPNAHVRNLPASRDLIERTLNSGLTGWYGAASGFELDNMSLGFNKDDCTPSNPTKRVPTWPTAGPKTAEGARAQREAQPSQKGIIPVFGVIVVRQWGQRLDRAVTDRLVEHGRVGVHQVLHPLQAAFGTAMLWTTRHGEVDRKSTRLNSS